jgi:large subunit ribosomal protein L9
MTEAGARIEKSEVFLPEGPIKHTGDFEADVILHPEVRFQVAVNVVGEHGEAPEALAEEMDEEMDEETGDSDLTESDSDY